MSKKIRLIDIDKARNEIIRELYESADFHMVVRHHCFNNFYTDKSKIVEDVKQEVIAKMLKKDPELIYEWYLINPKKPFAVALGILKKIFLKKTKYENYNKHSFGQYITFTSNLKQQSGDFDLLETDKIIEYEVLDNGEVVEKDKEHILFYLMSFLEPHEREVLEFELDKSVTKGKYRKEYKEQKELIFSKLRKIAIEKNIKIIF